MLFLDSLYLFLTTCDAHNDIIVALIAAWHHWVLIEFYTLPIAESGPRLYLLLLLETVCEVVIEDGVTALLDTAAEAKYSAPLASLLRLVIGSLLLRQMF